MMNGRASIGAMLALAVLVVPFPTAAQVPIYVVIKGETKQELNQLRSLVEKANGFNEAKCSDVREARRDKKAFSERYTEPPVIRGKPRRYGFQFVYQCDTPSRDTILSISDVLWSLYQQKPVRDPSISLSFGTTACYWQDCFHNGQLYWRKPGCLLCQ